MGRNPDATSASDDASLVRALRAGVPSALDALYRRHADAVFTAAYRVTGSVADAEDVLQDVFVGLRHALERYEERGTFAAWLQAVATRAALTRTRTVRRRAETALDAVESEATWSSRAEERIAVRAALAKLPESLRTVFLLKEVEGYSHRWIARHLGIGEGASRVRLHRAWKLLEADLRRDP